MEQDVALNGPIPFGGNYMWNEVHSEEFVKIGCLFLVFYGTGVRRKINNFEKSMGINVPGLFRMIEAAQSIP